MAEPSPLRARLEVALRLLAALVGTAGPALYAAIALARFLPASEEPRFIVGFLLFVPFWVGAMCAAFLARSAARSWAVCVLLTAALALLVHGTTP